MSESIYEQYQSEVLGVTPFRGLGPAPLEEPVSIPLVVECEEVTEFTRPLLHKILGSVGIKQWAQIKPGEVVEGRVHHKIHFCGGSDLGRMALGELIVWRLPTLNEMLGEGPEVTAQKKAAWSILKTFAVEFKKS